MNGGHWVDEDGNNRDECACQHSCSSHPYAVHTLAYCQTCGNATCPHCREVIHDAIVCLACVEVTA